MLRSVIQGAKRFHQPFGYLTRNVVSNWQCMNGIHVAWRNLKNEHVKFYSTDDPHYVEIDFSKKTYDDESSADKDLKTISPVLEEKPEFVYIERIQEEHYWGRIRSLMRRLGYTGYLEDLRHGRGRGVFIRDDVLEVIKPYYGTVYRSRRPDPI
ncbi:uncharacterized protein LOC133186310 [Saccostrea echinata]|uniref:uncharacterized protein LOC133186310 n=1 Tax=Saccostrea echinata TaxID=191078 RepID=UPI002A7EB5F7|nr:uncharacterized protein LOC133186310 [Saccostrea echinata]